MAERHKSHRWRSLWLSHACFYGHYSSTQKKTMDLIKLITDNTGISPAIAEQGVGLLLKTAQSHISPEHFAMLSGLIPDAAALHAAAPEPDTLSSVVSGIAGLFGGSVAQAGALAPLLSWASKAGIDEATALKIITSVVDFLKSKGGHDVAAILQGLGK